MILCDSVEKMQALSADLRRTEKSIGFVPTMGALHEGHASLLKKARAENDYVVLSIYVNPTQFNDPSDFNNYPITLNEDSKIAEMAGVDCLFLPTYGELYADSYRYRVTENTLSLKLCGAHRPGHFDGVLSVVMKLLNIVGCTRAYFGEKDFQQLELIRGMVNSFFMPMQIVPCQTVRENDGLAMSSRNQRLEPSERRQAPAFAAVLRSAPNADLAKCELEQSGFKVDYVEDIGTRRYGAVHLGKVRLIDNVER